MPSTEYVVPGLARGVEILVDRWGVPHLYADSSYDAFLAQGFHVAKERLFQLEMFRRRGLGRLAEVLGPDYVEQDRANRLFLYRGDLDEEWAAYGPDARGVARAFTAGINAYIAWALNDPEALPPEFRIYDFTPSVWKPEDVVLSRTHGLTANAEHEVARSTMLRDFGPEAEQLRRVRVPDDPLVVPDGLDLSLIDESILATYRLAFSPVAYPGQTESLDTSHALDGSNNWAVAAHRSTTGRAVLASDPHRAVTLPSLRYIAHLEAPDLSVIGATAPEAPGVMIGHNRNVAFGLTIWGADTEDLYVYELDPDDPRRYRYQDGWEPMSVIAEQVAVRDSDPALVELAFTRHGPVIHVDESRGFAVALRAVWLEPGMAPYLGSLPCLRAETGTEFVAGLDHWGVPAVNQVYADTSGGIGWQAAAVVPRRPNWDGSLPVPGDGRYEWDGFVRTSGLPSLRNPERGWVASANQMNLPEDFREQGPPITYDWLSHVRYERLSEWLGAGSPIGIDESLRMQSDAVHIHAVRLISFLAEVDATSIPSGDVLERLRAWDGDASVDSFEAVVFEVWWRRHFREAVTISHLRRHGLDEATIKRALPYIPTDDLRTDLRMLEAIDWSDATLTAEISDAVGDSLATALDELERLLGADRAAWTWGALHQALLVNEALEGDPGVPEAWRRTRRVPKQGTGDTVHIAGYDERFRQTVGASFRMVVDVGNWDASQAMNTPGQSGDPRSPHYDDLFDAWAAGETFPLLYSREAVEEHTEAVITLRPARPPSTFM